MAENISYNKKLKPFARSLRSASTKAEVRLWCELLSKGKTGCSFLRQRPIGSYIADFMCKELKLVVEVDGYTHKFKTEEDRERDETLASLGFTVLRFTDEVVMKELPNVERTLAARIAEAQKQIIPLPPSKGDKTVLL